MLFQSAVLRTDIDVLCLSLQEKWSKNLYIASICHGRTVCWPRCGVSIRPGTRTLESFKADRAFSNLILEPINKKLAHPLQDLSPGECEDEEHEQDGQTRAPKQPYIIEAIRLLREPVYLYHLLTTIALWNWSFYEWWWAANILCAIPRQKKPNLIILLSRGDSWILYIIKGSCDFVHFIAIIVKFLKILFGLGVRKLCCCSKNATFSRNHCDKGPGKRAMASSWQCLDKLKGGNWLF